MTGPSYSTSYIDGHVDARDRRELAQHGFARRAAAALPRADHLGDLADDLFAVADDERVDVLGERLGVVRAVPAGDHDRVRRARGPRCGPGTPARSTQVQQVRVDELGRQVERQHVEVGGGAVGVDAEQRQPARRASTPPCRSTARRRARRPRRRARSGFRRGSGAPGWGARSRRCRDRSGGRQPGRLPWCGRHGCPAPYRCSERASQPGPGAVRSAATGLTSPSSVARIAPRHRGPVAHRCVAAGQRPEPRA